MSPTGLRGLLNGSAPYGKTVRRLRAWYAGWLAKQGKGEAADELALSVLVSTVPEERRATARERLRACLVEIRSGDGE
jgi:hypothetical protein